jgi:hypothetical protein
LCQNNNSRVRGFKSLLLPAFLDSIAELPTKAAADAALFHAAAKFPSVARRLRLD